MVLDYTLHKCYQHNIEITSDQMKTERSKTDKRIRFPGYMVPFFHIGATRPNILHTTNLNESEKIMCIYGIRDRK